MGPGFKASPLSIAVPEGAFNKWVNEEVTRRSRNTPGGEGPGTSRRGFQWPKLNALTINDLTSQGREWVDFLGFKSGLQHSYGLTGDTLEIRKRIDDNASRYIVNYMRTTLVLVSCLLCERPDSLIGIIVILAILDWFSQFSDRTRLDKQSKRYQVLSVLVTLTVWIIVFLSKAMASISRSLLLVGLVVLLHASFRLPEDVERRKLKMHKRQQRIKR